MERTLITGQAVKFVDSTRVEHDAIVTAWWSQTCCNVVFASGDAAKGDDYGRQLERATSVCHRSQNNFGNYFFFVDEA